MHDESAGHHADAPDQWCRECIPAISIPGGRGGYHQRNLVIGEECQCMYCTEILQISVNSSLQHSALIQTPSLCMVDDIILLFRVYQRTSTDASMPKHHTMITIVIKSMQSADYSHSRAFCASSFVSLTRNQASASTTT